MSNNEEHPSVDRNDHSLGTTFSLEKSALTSERIEGIKQYLAGNPDVPYSVSGSGAGMTIRGEGGKIVSAAEANSLVSHVEAEYAQQAVSSKALVDEYAAAGNGSVARGAESINDLVGVDTAGRYRRPDGSMMSKHEIATIASHEQLIRDTEIERIDSIINDPEALLALAPNTPRAYRKLLEAQKESLLETSEQQVVEKDKTNSSGISLKDVKGFLKGELFRNIGKGIKVAASTLRESFYKIDPSNYATKEAYQKAKKMRLYGAFAATTGLAFALAPVVQIVSPTARAVGLVGHDVETGMDTMHTNADMGDFHVPSETHDLDINLPGFEHHEIGDDIIYDPNTDPFNAAEKSTEFAFGSALNTEDPWGDLKTRLFESPEQLANAMGEAGLINNVDGSAPTPEQVNELANQMRADPNLFGNNYDFMTAEVFDTATLSEVRTIDGSYDTVFQRALEGGDSEVVKSFDADNGGHYVEATWTDKNGQEHSIKFRLECGGQIIEPNIDYPQELIIPPPPEHGKTEYEKTEVEKETEKSEVEKTEGEKDWDLSPDVPDGVTGDVEAGSQTEDPETAGNGTDSPDMNGDTPTGSEANIPAEEANPNTTPQVEVAEPGANGDTGINNTEQGADNLAAERAAQAEQVTANQAAADQEAAMASQEAVDAAATAEATRIAAEEQAVTSSQTSNGPDINAPAPTTSLNSANQ